MEHLAYITNLQLAKRMAEFDARQSALLKLVIADGYGDYRYSDLERVATPTPALQQYLAVCTELRRYRSEAEQRTGERYNHEVYLRKSPRYRRRKRQA